VRVCVCVCVCVCVRARAHASLVRACMRACVCVLCVCAREGGEHLCRLVEASYQEREYHLRVGALPGGRERGTDTDPKYSCKNEPSRTSQPVLSSCTLAPLSSIPGACQGTLLPEAVSCVFSVSGPDSKRTRAHLRVANHTLIVVEEDEMDQVLVKRFALVVQREGFVPGRIHCLERTKFTCRQSGMNCSTQREAQLACLRHFHLGNDFGFELELATKE